MGASQIPAASGGSSAPPSDNWALISSVTPTGGATTVVFSSISAKTKLMLRINNPGFGSSGTVTLTFNGDTGAKYSLFGAGYNASTAANVAPLSQHDNTSLQLSTSTTSLQGVVTIVETDTVNVKELTAYYKAGNPGGTNAYPNTVGSYVASAAITSVTLTTTGTFAASGTIALYGVSA